MLTRQRFRVEGSLAGRDGSMPHESPGWQRLAEQASKEMDHEKLIELVKQLNRALERQGKIHAAEQGAVGKTA